MNYVEKWTVRNIPAATLDKLWEVRSLTSGVTLADLIEEAVELWYNELPCHR